MGEFNLRVLFFEMGLHSISQETTTKTLSTTHLNDPLLQIPFPRNGYGLLGNLHF